MGKEYITALRESLEKKVKVLDEIRELCRLQQELLSEETVDYEAFDRYFDDKDICIDKLNRLDEGFDLLYNRVKDELLNNKEEYADEIRTMQSLIKEITDRSTSIEALEERNRKGIADTFSRERRQSAENKRSVNVAMNYYRQMNGLNADRNSRMDKKK